MRERILRRRRVTAEPVKKGLLERVATYQQAALLLAGLMYALGYLPRAINAWENNLGALPGVRFDYLVAGALLLLPPVAVFLFFWGVWRSVKMLAAWAEKDPKRKDRVSRALLVSFILGMIVGKFGDGWVKIGGIIFFSSSIIYLLVFNYLVTPNNPSLPSSAPKETAKQKWRKLRKALSWVGHGALYVWGAVVALLSGVFLLLLFALAVGYGAIAPKYIPPRARRN